MKKAYLILEDGHVFEGYSFGAECKGIGELVFNTQAVGYIETLTDPSYFGQIVMQTFPMIGNYGIIEEDFAGKCALGGYVVREYCEKPSNFRSEYDIDTFLKKNNINKQEMIMIGDQLLTDIACANKLKVDCVLVHSISRKTEKWYTKINRKREKIKLRRIERKDPVLANDIRQIIGRKSDHNE